MTLKLRNRQIIIAVSAFVLVMAIVYTKQHYLIIHNKSESLPSHWFLIAKNQIHQKDQIFAFRVRENPVYRSGEIFIKIVGGVAGDEVMIKNRDFYINDQATNQLIGTAKTQSLKGLPLTMADVGIIPPNHFFAYTTHQDSYDSRYQEIGLINAKDIIGTAVFAL